ncbi:sensor histidine kinase [Terriglobus albidus]|nr:ATP-binding protein [Terriglobus albidus]
MFRLFPRMFGKVFLSFWASSLLVLIAVGVVNAALGTRPLLRVWLANSLTWYGQTAVELYEHGGPSALNNYLTDIQASGIDGALLGPDGALLGSHKVPATTDTVLARERLSRRNENDIQTWTSAIPIPGNRGEYIFVALEHPRRRARIAFQPAALLARMVAGLGVASLLCLLMARYLTRPIRSLQGVARRIAAGDLKARAAPVMGPRDDELGELAIDFDRMADRVQTLIERQQTLLRDISHEFRSPLARLTLSAELVKRGDTDAASRMEGDLRRLEALISELLTLSRMEASDRNSRRDRIDLSGMVRRILEDAAFEGRPEQKTLVQTGANEVMMQGDANLLERCIENVVRNAIQHTPQHTGIEVNVTLSDETPAGQVATIRVIDEGEGVPEHALPHLFEPFFRVSASREQSGRGAGLGLSISQRIVELHGGAMEACNRAEGGLEVTMRFPVVQGWGSNVGPASRM